MHRTVHHASPIRRAHLLAVACAVATVSIVGCSSSGSSAKNPPVTVASKAKAKAVAWTPRACKPTDTTVPKAAAVKGSKSDYDITSFDGTNLRVHWFPLSSAGAKSAPTVFMGPGWSLPGDVDISSKGPNSVLTIDSLQSAGYNVLTWDPRGFGESTGAVMVDSIDYEAKDLSEQISWVAAQKGVQLDGKGDPRMGMVGESYGGGIQFVTAAIDCRVDAITPTIAWNSLATSLYKADPSDYFSSAILGWLNRYVKGDTSAPVVPTFQTVDQNAKVHTFDNYPVAAGSPLFAMATNGTLKLQAEGGSGPVASGFDKSNIIARIGATFAPTKATNAVNLTVTNGTAHQLVLGAPDLRLGYSGTIDGPVTKPTRLFAQLVDDATGRVVGNQVTPIEVTLDGKTHAVQVALEIIAFDAKPGASLTLQLVASTVGYAIPQLGGTMTFSRIELKVPTAAS